MASGANFDDVFDNVLVARGLPMAPANYRTRLDDNPTLLVSWWCTGFALTIIIVRVIGRYVRSEKLFMEDKVMALSIIPLLIRMAFVHPILLYGTNNTNHLGQLTQSEIDQRMIGSKLVLPARIFYAMFIWTVKFTVSEFLKRITYSTWSPKLERMLRLVRIFLFVTFGAVVIATLAECQPFSHYWQVVPDPGFACRCGYAQLLVMGICDVVTDIILVVFPIPAVVTSSLPLKRKISVSLLFSLSLILIAVTAYRMPAVIAQHGSQQRRSLIASLEILAAAATSNALIIGSFVRDKGVRKGKYQKTASRADSVDQPSINRQMTRQHWGSDSDEDLFRSLGGRLESVASGMPDAPLPRKPSIVGPSSEDEAAKPNLPQQGPAWFSANSSTENSAGRISVTDMNSSSPYPPRISTLNSSRSPPNFSRHTPTTPPANREPYQDMSFFDVGGVLEEQSDSRDPSDYSPTDTRRPSIPHSATQDFADPNSRQKRNSVRAWADVEWPLKRGSSASRDNNTTAATENTVSSALPPKKSSILPSFGRQSQSASAPKQDPGGFDLKDAGGLLL